jgi:hypothetical protein
MMRSATLATLTACLFVVLAVTACSSSKSSTPACENVTNKDLLEAVAAPAASSVNAGRKLGNNDGYYVARSDGALWATTYPPVSNGQGALMVPLNPQARIDAPDLGTDVPATSPIFTDFTVTNPAASAVVACAASPHSSS